MSSKTSHVVFDLDDTLYSELAYVHSAFEFVGQLVAQAYGDQDAAAHLRKLSAAGDKNPIQTYWSEQFLPIVAMADCVSCMRGHRPNIALREGAQELLLCLGSRGIQWSILTDGRSITQRQKISALSLREIASAIYISQERDVSKPDPAAYMQIERDFPDVERFFYVADNPAKDFVSPNDLGWVTIMLRDNGNNTHRQDLELPNIMQAHFTIETLMQVLEIMEKA